MRGFSMRGHVLSLDEAEPEIREFSLVIKSHQKKIVDNLPAFYVYFKGLTKLRRPNIKFVKEDGKYYLHIEDIKFSEEELEVDLKTQAKATTTLFLQEVFSKLIFVRIKDVNLSIRGFKMTLVVEFSSSLSPGLLWI